MMSLLDGAKFDDSRRPRQKYYHAKSTRYYIYAAITNADDDDDDATKFQSLAMMFLTDTPIDDLRRHGR